MCGCTGCYTAAASLPHMLLRELIFKDRNLKIKFLVVLLSIFKVNYCVEGNDVFSLPEEK